MQLTFTNTEYFLEWNAPLFIRQENDTPPALYHLVQPASAVHNYNTRYATLIKICADHFPELINMA